MRHLTRVMSALGPRSDLSPQCLQWVESGHLVVCRQTNIRVIQRPSLGERMFRNKFNRWVRAPLLTGPVALFCAGLGLALPTLVRAAFDGVETGCEFTPYLPSVFLCARTLRWWQAGAVALASVAIMGGVLDPPRHMLEMPCFLPS